MANPETRSKALQIVETASKATLVGAMGFLAVGIFVPGFQFLIAPALTAATVDVIQLKAIQDYNKKPQAKPVF